MQDRYIVQKLKTKSSSVESSLLFIPSARAPRPVGVFKVIHKSSSNFSSFLLLISYDNSSHNTLLLSPLSFRKSICTVYTVSDTRQRSCRNCPFRRYSLHVSYLVDRHEDLVPRAVLCVYAPSNLVKSGRKGPKPPPLFGARGYHCK